LGFKAGIGTSSRLASTSRGEVTVGVLVQANFSGVLRVLGVPIPCERVGVPSAAKSLSQHEQRGNSCVIVIATDGHFDSRQLGRIARRAIFAMARAGSDFTGGSGDYALAFSTAQSDLHVQPEFDLNGVFTAVMEAVEEALLNSLFMASTTTGFEGHTRYAVPHDRMLELLRIHRALATIR
jgi:D-aminopeptidase